MTIIALDQVLAAVGIEVEDDRTAVLLRHTGDVPALAAALPTLAAEDQEAYDSFNAFHIETEARTIRTRTWAVAGVADGPGVLVTGLYRVGPDRPITGAEWRGLPVNDRLTALTGACAGSVVRGQGAHAACHPRGVHARHWCT